MSNLTYNNYDRVRISFKCVSITYLMFIIRSDAIKGDPYKCLLYETTIYFYFLSHGFTYI